MTSVSTPLPLRPPSTPTLSPYTTLFRSLGVRGPEIMGWFFPTDVFRKMHGQGEGETGVDNDMALKGFEGERKSTRLNSSHANISYAVFCWKKKRSRR